MSATAIIELDQLPDVIVVPDTAVFSRDGQSVVYAVIAAARSSPGP